MYYFTIMNNIAVPELTLLAWTQDQWEGPYIIGASAPSISEHLDSLSGNAYYLLQLPYSEWTKRPKLKYDTQLPNGIYVNTWR